MELQDMNLEQVIARLAELDEEVRAAEDVDVIEKAKEEKASLLERKAELEEIEQRKSDALKLQAEPTIAKVVETHKEGRKMEFTAASPEYRSAWLKRMMGKELDEVEQRSIAASGVAGAIPTQTSEKIFSKIREMAPLLDEVTLLHVAGNVNFAVEGTNNVAALHTENAEATAQADTLVTVSLGGYEIVKAGPYFQDCSDHVHQRISRDGLLT